MTKNFKICRKCGALIQVLEDCTCSDCGIQCCGERVELITPNSQDGSVEKHVPMLHFLDKQTVEVSVGETLHPMQEAHHIAWIMIRTTLGEQVHYLDPHGDPKTTFALSKGEKVLQAISYCNLHGLWQKNLVD